LFSASVYQDVSFGPLNLGWPEEKVRRKVEEALKKTGAWDLKDRPTHFLSHGQKKRVAIAGVLAMEPRIIILDEPTAGLDPDYTGQMMQLLADFNQSGATVVLSSHNLMRSMPGQMISLSWMAGLLLQKDCRRGSSETRLCSSWLN
jgi:cobalt/nickel transport system ATP-binding protein